MADQDQRAVRGQVRAGIDDIAIGGGADLGAFTASDLDAIDTGAVRLRAKARNDVAAERPSEAA